MTQQFREKETWKQADTSNHKPHSAELRWTYQQNAHF